jgi:uncharacterized protein (TIGR02145 family)
MLRKKLQLALGILILAGSALAVTGVILDKVGNPISRVKVQLLSEGSTVSTGSDGSFTLLPVSATIGKQGKAGIQVALKNGVLQFHLPASIQGSMRTTDIRGNQINSMPSQHLSAGDHQYSPLGNASVNPGIYLVQYQLGNQKGVLKLAATNTSNTSGSKLNAVTTVLRLATQAVIDSVKFSKQGYASKTVAISDYATNLGKDTLYAIAAGSSSSVSVSSSVVGSSSSDVSSSSSSVDVSSSSVAPSSSSVSPNSSSVAPSSSSVDISSSSVAPSSSSAVVIQSQAITFAALSAGTYGDADFTLDATASSGLVVTFSTTSATVCSVTGSTVTLVGAGSCVITASQAGNSAYSAASNVTRTMTVGKKTLTLVSATVTTKVYDGTTTAGITGPSLDGKINLDDVSLSAGIFMDANVGTGKTVTVTSASLFGAQSSNYTLTTFSGLSGIITAKSLGVIGVTASPKVYDGTTTATITGGTLSGVLGSDDVTLFLGSGTFATSNVGTAKAVTVTGSTLNGTAKTNYSLSPISGLTADITAKAVTITASAQSKIYGNVIPSLGSTGYTIPSGGLIAGDDITGVTLASAGATGTADAGPYSIVPSAAVGPNASNYAVTYANGTLTVAPRPITIAADAQGKFFGNPDPLLTFSVTTGALQNGDTFTGALSNLTGETEGLHAIEQGTLALSNNYTLTYVGTNLTIFPAHDCTYNAGVNTLNCTSGESYQTVTIGSQVWMKNNLNFGTNMLSANDQSQGSVVEKYCYSNTESYCTASGGLYQWAEAMLLPSTCNVKACASSISTGNHQGICPTGWHIPKPAEWNTLNTFIGEPVGTRMKTSTNWIFDDYNLGGGDNSSGWTGLPAGFRHTNSSIVDATKMVYYWSASENRDSLAGDRALTIDWTYLADRNDYKLNGFSVRCIMDPYAASPAFSPAGGTFTAPQLVTLTSATSGASIYYTTDGSTPTNSSTLYSGPITVGGSQTIKAIALASGYTKSLETSSAYVINLVDSRSGTQTYSTVKIGSQVWMAQNLNFPTASGSWCKSNTDATGLSGLSATSTYCDTYGRFYEWTTAVATTTCPIGWHLPSDAEWTALETRVGGTATAGTKLKTLTGWNTGSGYIAGTDNFGFSALPGGYYNLSSANIGNTGYWWTDTPNSGGAKYRSLTYNNEYVNHNDGILTYGFSVRCIQNPIASSPSFSVAAGTYTSTQTVTLTSTTSGASIYYTTDGATPTTASTLYTTAITVSGSQTVKAIVVASGYTNSLVTSGNFVINLVYGGQSYKTVKIDSQVWMAENLNIGTQLNGTAFAANQLNNTLIEKYCYGDAPVKCTVEGGLYQWAEAMALPNACNALMTPACGGTISTGNHQGICPSGWHIPKPAEWDALNTYLGPSTAGMQMKTITEWVEFTGTNSSGFTGLPAGDRESNGGFNYREERASFWAATENDASNVSKRSLIWSDNTLMTGSSSKMYGYSVRCLLD